MVAPHKRAVSLGDLFVCHNIDKKSFTVLRERFRKEKLAFNKFNPPVGQRVP